MKRIKLFLLMCLPLLAQAQIPFDYHFGQRTSYKNDSSLIRVNSDSSLLFYYIFPNTHRKELVRAYSNGLIWRTQFDPYFTIHDMATAGNYAFLCGQNTSSGNAVLGVYQMNGSLTFHEINLASQYSGTCFTDIVAYQTQTGAYKVALLGYSNYCSSGYPGIIQADCPSNLSYFHQYLNYNIHSIQFVMEIDMTAPIISLGTYSIKAVQDKTHDEILHDIVLTDNYVSFIGLKKDLNNKSVTIHRCSRSNVLADFNNYYYYPCASFGYEWLNPIGCHMKKDSLAIVAFGDDMGNGYSSQIRTFDLVSMDMTSSQMFTFNDFKPFPMDLIYTPESHLLVLLQYARIPTIHTVFYNLEPYNTNPTYTARFHTGYDTSYYSFFSMDRMYDGNYFTSSGGAYLFIKNASVIQDTASCYYAFRQIVLNKAKTIQKIANHNFVQCTVSFNISNQYFPLYTGYLTPLCSD